MEEKYKIFEESMILLIDSLYRLNMNDEQILDTLNHIMGKKMTPEEKEQFLEDFYKNLESTEH